MERRTVPGTDLSLSVIGMGCWAIGGQHWGGDVTDERSIGAVHAALDAGINWFDTAPIYGHGHADEVLVRALGDRRREVVIATKVGVRFDAERDHAQSDLSPAHIREDCEASLKRLGVERIDLLQVHWPCERGTPLDDTLEALSRLQEEGKVRCFGLCNYGPDGVAQAIEHGSARTLQTPLSMVRREGEVTLRPVVRPEPDAPPRLAVLAYETLCRGLLTGKHRTLPRYGQDDMRARDPRFWGSRFMRTAVWVDLLRQAAARLHAPVPALPVAWVLGRPWVSAAIVGVKGAEQVREVVKAAEVAGRPEALRLLDRIAGAYRL